MDGSRRRDRSGRTTQRSRGDGRCHYEPSRKPRAWHRHGAPGAAGGGPIHVVACSPRVGGRALRKRARGGGTGPRRAVDMKRDRVLQMSVDEVVVRSRQEASKWLDWMAAVAAPVTLPERVKPRIGGVPGRAAGTHRRVVAALVDHFWERVPLRFFEGAARADTTARLIERIPETRGRILAAADGICRGRFDLLGYRGLDFGDPVDWHLDPVSGRRAPFVHWSRLDPLDPAEVGDSKVIWELNRHQWGLHLGQAYRLTGDERYAEAFARYVQDWLRANPPGIGINWASSLEVALRLIAWCWALVLFEGARAVSAELRARLLAAIGGHARHVERYLSSYFSPNTHLTGEALGLVYAGALFPAPPPARRCRSP